MLNRWDVYAWSLLNPKPICCWHEQSQSHIVYWQGMAMTRVHALFLVQEKWIQSYATPTMKIGAFNEFKRAYYAGGFGQVDWSRTLADTNPDDYLGRLRKWIVKNNEKLFVELQQQYSIQEAMLWFADEEVIVDG